MSSAVLAAPPANGPDDCSLGLSEIQAAARRIEEVVVRTPLLSSPLLDRQLGLRLLVKAETLQRTGSFKFRGAYNALVRLTPIQQRAGVVAFSSGNHAQGVAAAAELLGIPALIVMPDDAPDMKIANTRAYGAEVLFYDRQNDDREAVARMAASERGATVIPPYDHPDVIAGQGTVGLEIATQAAELGLQLDSALVCCGGGGLTAGIATALAALSPHTRVYAAEPALFDDTARSLAAGERISNPPGRRSICDALMTMIPGRLTFPINQRLLAGALSASDQEVERAVATAFDSFKLVVEPGGAAAMAVVLADPDRFKGQVVAVTASGGNLDPSIAAEMLRRQPASAR